MNTAVVNIKIDPTTKREAQKVANNLGLTLSALIKGYLRHLVKTKEVHFKIGEEPTAYLIQALKEAEEDIIKVQRNIQPCDQADCRI